MTDIDELTRAIETFERALPGWWWSIGQCSIGGHASCGPEATGPDAHLLYLEDRTFDEGFLHDTDRGSPAEALTNVMEQALKAKRAQG